MGANSSKETPTEPESSRRPEQEEEDDEPDEWDKRINATGCAEEQTKMNDCYFEKKDWRACSQEMLAFKECWKRKGNDQRTATTDA